jgi:catechol 2,3-dioxygenase-like lactoylglutathione lyase family enzyme
MAFSLKRLDHVNVRTADLEGMIAWYAEMLGMRSGPRPDFPFPGAWLYIGDHPVVHLVGQSARPDAEEADLRLEHFALSATGLTRLIERAKAASERCEVRRVPGFPIVQVNLWDPDGNHIHIDFDAAEAEGLDI